MALDSFGFTSGYNLYCRYRNTSSGGTVWNGSSFEAYNAANWATYANAATDVGGRVYQVTRPAAIPAGTRIYVQWFRRRGGSPASNDYYLGATTTIVQPASTGVVDTAETTNTYSFTPAAGMDVSISHNTFTVTLDGTQVASGPLRLGNPAGYLYSVENYDALAPGSVLSSTIAELTADSVYRVTDTYASVTVRTTYTFSGRDVLVDAKVENRSEAQRVNMVALTGMDAVFPETPTRFAIIRSDWSDASALFYFYPSDGNWFGPGWIKGSTWGLGINQRNCWGSRTAAAVKYVSGDPGSGSLTAALAAGVLTRRPILLSDVGGGVGPLETRTARWTLRFHRAADGLTDTTLMTPFKTWMNGLFPALLYDRDDRMLVYTNPYDPSRIAAGNPYGCVDGPTGARRLDTAAGAAAFGTTYALPLSGKIAAILVWNLNAGVTMDSSGLGVDRGARYRTDFDVLPTEIAANLATTVSGVTGRSVKIGCQARPAEVTGRTSWSADSTWRWANDRRVYSAPTSVADRELARFTAMNGSGFRAYYLDVIGGVPGDEVKLQRIRTTVGGGTLLWAETHNSALLPFAGLHNNTVTNNGDGTWTVPGVSADQLALYRWLYPGCAIYARVTDGDLTERQAACNYLGSIGVTPMLQDFQAPSQAAFIDAWNTAYLTGAGGIVFP